MHRIQRGGDFDRVLASIGGLVGGRWSSRYMDRHERILICDEKMLCFEVFSAMSGDRRILLSGELLGCWVG